MTRRIQWIASLWTACLWLVACTPAETEGTPPGGLSASYASVGSASPTALWYASRKGQRTFLNLGGGEVAASLDGEATWTTFNLGHQDNPGDPNGLVLKHDLVWVSDGDALVTTEHGITRLDLAAGGFGVVAGQPPAIPPGGWTVDPASGRLYVLQHTVDEHTLSVDDDTVSLTLHYCDDYLAGPPTWHTVAIPDPAYNPRRFRPSLHISDDGALYVAHLFGLYRSDDGGGTWDAVAVVPDESGGLSGSGVSILVTGAGTIFAITPNDSFVSRDGGASYQRFYPNGDAGLRDLMPALTQSPDDGVLYFSERSLLASSDEGESWAPLWSLSAFGDSAQKIEHLHHAADGDTVEIRPWGVLRVAAGGTSLSPLTLPQGATATGPRITAAGAGFAIKTPAGATGYVARWGGGVGRVFDGGERWTLGPFHAQISFLGQLDSGALLLAEAQGVHRSDDGGESWSAAAPVPSSVGPNDTEVQRILELPDGTLYLSGISRSRCATYPHLTSPDGASWALLTEAPTILGANPGVQHVEVRSVDRDGILFGTAYAINATAGPAGVCNTVERVAVRSDDRGATWVTTPGVRTPHLVTHANTLVYVDQGDLLLWRKGDSRWASVGALQFPEYPEHAWNSLDLPAVDATDHLVGTQNGRIWRSSELR
ncbi:MAG: sialidase family protein [Myxococcota bacterium]